jgi:hypothetical protein
MRKVVLYLWTLALVTAAVAGIAYRAACSPRDRDQPFSAPKWLQGDALERGSMARDLASGAPLKGKTQAEVQALLGPPDLEVRWTLIYKVDFGYRFGSSPWLYDLVLSFDASGTFVSGEVCD